MTSDDERASMTSQDDNSSIYARTRRIDPQVAHACTMAEILERNPQIPKPEGPEWNTSEIYWFLPDQPEECADDGLMEEVWFADYALRWGEVRLAALKRGESTLAD